jgi:hypothetical protein
MSPTADLAPWLGLAGLGAFHGLNPAMGWLLAVALGLQEARRAAVWRALLAVALGHEASIVLAAALVGGLQLLTAPDVLRAGSAVLLLGFGSFKLLRPGRAHLRWVGLHLGWRDVVIWSFLMSSAHGAGLMLAPLLLGLPASAHAHDELAGLGLSLAGPVGPALLLAGAAGLVHTLAMLAVMAIVAGVVFEKLGLGFLRQGWVNLDLVWAVALLTTGVVTMLS